MKNAELAIAKSANIGVAAEIGFTMMPNWLLFDKSVSQQAKMLYMIMCHYGRNGECFPSQETLAKDLGCVARTVRRILGELCRVGLVDNLGRVKYRSNSYALPEQDSFIPLDRMKESAKGKGFKDLNPVCESQSALIFQNPKSQLRLVPEQDSTSNHQPTLQTEQAASNQSQEVVVDAIVKLYISEGVLEREANMIATKKPDPEYAKKLIASSQESWVRDKPATIVFFGSRAKLPTRQAPSPGCDTPDKVNGGAKKGKPKHTPGSGDGDGGSSAPIDFDKYKPGGKYAYLVAQYNDGDEAEQSEGDDNNESCDIVAAPQPAQREKVWIDVGYTIRPAHPGEQYESHQVRPNPWAHQLQGDGVTV